MKKILFYGIFILIWSSCNKTHKTNSIARQLFSKNIPKETVAIISGAKDTVLVTSKKTKISFKKGIFENKRGEKYEGQITLRIKAVYSPSELIFSGISTISKGKLLQTGGMIYLSAFDSTNSQLSLPKENFFTVMFPKETCPNKQMDFYIGNEDTTGNVEWILIEKEKKKITKNLPIVLDSVMTESQIEEYKKSLDYFIFKSNDLGWINCDKEIESTANTILKVKSNTELNPTFKLIFPEIKAATFARFENGEYVFYNIPKGQQAILIGYTLVDDKYYFSYSEVTIQSDETIEQSLTIMDRQEIENKIKKIAWVSI